MKIKAIEEDSCLLTYFGPWIGINLKTQKRQQMLEQISQMCQLVHPWKIYFFDIVEFIIQ